MNRNRTFWISGIIVVLALLFALPHIVTNTYWLHIIILTSINVLLAVSLRALIQTGQVSLGTSAFMIVGSYGSSLMVMKTGMSFWLSMPLSAVLAALIALLLGTLFLRAKGIYFSILTIMLSEIIRLVVFYWPSMTSGSSGLRNVPAPNPVNFFGLYTATFNTPAAYYHLVLVVVVISLFILWRVERSWLGLMWSAIKESDTLAQSSGINIMGHKVLIFVITAFFIGIGGALYAHYLGSLSPYDTPGNPLAMMNSIYVLVYVIFGGETSYIGPIIGAVILTIVPEVARPAAQYMPLIFGALLIITVFLRPSGLISMVDLAVRGIKRLIRSGNTGAVNVKNETVAK